MKSTVLPFILVLLVSSCGPIVVDTNSKAIEPKVVSNLTLTPPPVETSSPDGCLPPLEDFAFPIGDTNIIPPNLDAQLPPQQWKQISRVPGAFESNSVQSIDILLVRSRNMKNEIWVMGNKGELLRYDISTNQWDIISDNSSDSFSAASVILTLDKDNNIWAVRRTSSRIINLPLIMRYDDRENRFIEVSLAIMNESTLRVEDIKVDHKGRFWMIVQNEEQSRGESFQLYSLDTEALDMKSHPLRWEILPSLVVLQDNSIVVLTKQSKEYPESSALVNYSPPTQQSTEIRIPSTIYKAETAYGPSFGPSLFLDRQNRLWLDDLGWLDLSEGGKGYNTWFRVVRSPVFIGMFIANPSWSWGGPTFTYETTDGKIWYNSPRGAGWLDPNVGKWCVFTSYSSQVVADNERNLWIVADGWLYENVSYSSQVTP